MGDRAANLVAFHVAVGVLVVVAYLAKTPKYNSFCFWFTFMLVRTWV
jgi:hypothetical protein